MKRDFEGSTRLRLERLEGEEKAFVGGPPLPFKAVLLAGNKTIGALEKGQSETGGALSIAFDQAGRSLMRGLGEAGRSLELSLHKVGKWLRIGR